MHSDASYLGEPKEKSRATEHFYLGLLPQDKQWIILNRPIYVIVAKLSAFFANDKEGKVICLILEDMGHPQLPTSIDAVIIPLPLALQMKVTSKSAHDTCKYITFGFQIRLHNNNLLPFLKSNFLSELTSIVIHPKWIPFICLWDGKLYILYKSIVICFILCLSLHHLYYCSIIFLTACNLSWKWPVPSPGKT